ncbi:MAG TPA: ABC transporter permease [Jiangellaceae bacterium]|jgi:ABC-2 type transport system permease protein|nr:ABC transporter permease [Jiangellaceae bacterium]
MTAFTGTGRLVRLALRRDRVQLPLWLTGLILVQAVTISSIVGLYPAESDRIALAMSSARSPVSLMFNGLVSGPSMGATVVTQGFLTVAIGAALMSTLAVVRHTRQNEETGRAEMIGAGIVGRHASLTAALLVAIAANVVLAFASAAVLIANDLPAASSLAAGAEVGAVGITFAAVAAVAAQAAETSRGANALAAAAVGATFVLRAVGAVTGHVSDNGVTVISAWPTWLSPIGWGEEVRAFDQDNWWIFGLFGLAFAGLVGTAFVLTAHRDIGAGLRSVRPGPPVAVARLLSPLGLAWRLQRGVLYGWAAGVAVLGAIFGGVADEIEEFAGDSEEMADYLDQLGGAGQLTDLYFAVSLGLAAIVVAAYATQALLRLRSEEAAGRAEPILATAVSRTRWMWSHIGVTLVGIVLLVVLAGLAAGVTYGLVIGDVAGQAPRLVAAALAYLPAVLVVAGLVVAAFGILPSRAVAIAWTAVAVFFLMAQLGPLLDLPQAVLDVSPFTHIPAVPSADLTIVPLVVLIAVAVALAIAGLAGFRRRDLATS